MDWYALHCSSNFELRALEELQRLEIETFRPTNRVKSQFARGGYADKPILPGYLFARFDVEKHRIPILRIGDRIRGGLHILGFALEPQAIPDEEIAILRAMIAAGPVTHQPYWPAPGELAEIVCGPLVGSCGVVHRLKGKCRVIMSVTGLSGSFSVEVDSHMLRAATKAA